MSYYVYEDVARTKKVLAKKTTERNRGIRYYCPNYECDARMFLWNLDGEKVLTVSFGEYRANEQ